MCALVCEMKAEDRKRGECETEHRIRVGLGSVLPAERVPLGAGEWLSLVRRWAGSPQARSFHFHNQCGFFCPENSPPLDVTRR